MSFLSRLPVEVPWRDVVLLVLGGCGLLLSFLGIVPLVLGVALDPAWIAVALCGVPILKDAAEGLVTRFDIKADVLVSLALVAAVLIGEIFAAGDVAFIMQIGSLLEELAVGRARAGIEKLVRLTPTTGRVLRNGEEVSVAADELREGDLLRVLPGETIPADGVIISGESSVDQSVMTGESIPVDKMPGDSVTSGTTNMFGTFDMRATGVGAESAIRRMIRLVQSADAGKARIVRLADRWATWIVVTALTASILIGFITKDLIRAVTILVVFCPCALVLATPTAIMAAIGNATKHGFLVREGDALERLAKVNTIAFDKTGTLTYGTPKVIHVECCGELSEPELFQMAATAEIFSEHPLGKAVTASYQKKYGTAIPKPDKFAMQIGKGVLVEQAGKTVLAGNEKLLADHKITVPDTAADAAKSYLEQGCTVIWLADQSCQGFLVLSDTIRPESRSMIHALSEQNTTPVLLTGDNANAAQAIAGQLGITQVRSGCLPEDKLQFIRTAQEQQQPVCMIGDGINDAPALKTAHVGIAMGGVGSDIAIDAADIALVDDEVKELPHLFRLSKRMMRTIKCNLSFSMGLNFLAIILAITGVLGPVSGALVHNAGSVLVILNSALLLKWRKKS